MTTGLTHVPAQQRITLGRFLFTSDFDGGNMGSVECVEHALPSGAASSNEKVPGGNHRTSSGQHSCEEFVVTIAPDCVGTEYETNHRTWFYFGVSLQPPPPLAGDCHRMEPVDVGCMMETACGSSDKGIGQDGTSDVSDSLGTGCRMGLEDLEAAVSKPATSSVPGAGQDVVQDASLQPDEIDLAAPCGDAQDGQGQAIDIVIRNMNNQTKLFKEGYRPWWHRLPGNPLWQRLTDSAETGFSYEWEGDPADGGTGFSIRWRFTLPNDGSTTYFAFCVPFGYERCQRLLMDLEWQLQEADLGITQDSRAPLRSISAVLQEEWAPVLGESVYFHRHQIGMSHEGRKIDLLTITSAAGLSDVAVEAPAPCETHGAGTVDSEVLGHEVAVPATEPGEELSAASERSCGNWETLPSDIPASDFPPRHFAGRPLIFLSARVHPGETPGHFAFFGLVRFLLSADPRAAELRSRFVFKLVPMLNPDGVARGHHRTNARGLDLNRCYTNPTSEEHEAVWLTKRLLEFWTARKRLLFCVDFHGHPSRRGCFLLGNKNSGARQTWNIAFARLCQLNSPHFEVDSCDFEDKAAADGDVDGPGKHGTQRAAVHRDCQVCHAYTFECNYHSGRSTKPVLMTRGLHQVEESPGTNVKTQNSIPYDPSCWAQAGEAISVSILDLYGHNCFSRLPVSRYGSLARLLSLSPSFPSHRGQYAPPDPVPEVLGVDHASIFEQQLPCHRARCSWNVCTSPANPGVPSLASGGSSPLSSSGHGHRTAGPQPSCHLHASLGSATSWPWPQQPHIRGCSGAAMSQGAAFGELSASISSCGSRKSSCGGKPPAWPLSYLSKPSTLSSRRPRRAHGTPLPASQLSKLPGANTPEGRITKTTGMAVARNPDLSCKAAGDQKLSSSNHHCRARRTASTGALIVASGARQHSSGVRHHAAITPSAVTSTWSGHR